MRELFEDQNPNAQFSWIKDEDGETEAASWERPLGPSAPPRHIIPLSHYEKAGNPIQKHEHICTKQKESRYKMKQAQWKWLR